MLTVSTVFELEVWHFLCVLLAIFPGNFSYFQGFGPLAKLAFSLNQIKPDGANSMCFFQHPFHPILFHLTFIILSWDRVYKSIPSPTALACAFNLTQQHQVALIYPASTKKKVKLIWLVLSFLVKAGYTRAPLPSSPGTCFQPNPTFPGMCFQPNPTALACAFSLIQQAWHVLST